ncbi:MAG: N-acetylglucosamine/diacetylchitobiose ABC transporter substrate-binding protein [Bifidobacteriaceae bacterium]|jgi:N-acetylglucosamine transport system substrate-binding protein|nr:N-acetylglucosamine/diacetylchitobiose ABC transporter substrate-binding protein [Bifidobacteriaceae bacterium]
MLVAAALAAGLLAGCAEDKEPAGGASSGGGVAAADNPFGAAAGSTVDAAIFDGGYSTDYVDFAAAMVKDKLDVTTVVSPVTDVVQELQPRIVGGDPPDLVDWNQLPPQDLRSQLAPLDDLYAALNYDGVKIEDAIVAGAKATGTFNGQALSVPYVLTLFSLWYSASLFEENGWTPPETWDDMMAICEEAKAQDKYCFTFGKEAAGYWAWMVLEMAIKEGGKDVYLNLANLKPDAWRDPALVGAFEAVKDSIDKGYWVPGGQGTQFTVAQAQWSQQQEALFYFSGSWIEAEMADATAEGFEMTAWPAPTLTSNPALPFETVQLSAGENYIVPAAGKNTAGAKEVLRAMLSKEAATNFSKTRMAPTIVKDTVPADGWGSTALASIMARAEASGDTALPYTLGWSDQYNMDPSVIWGSFLGGEMSVEDAISQLQALSDEAAADPSIEKMAYEW